MCSQKGRDGVTTAKILAYGDEEVDGVSYYTIEYQSSSSRGDKHFISKVTIVNKQVLAARTREYLCRVNVSTLP